MEIRCSALDELGARATYDILRLRSQVFVVEQHCAYPDIDGRDLEPEALQYWFPGECPDGSTVAAALRVLDHPTRPGVRVIGRVATHPSQRGRGLASRLIVRALADHPTAPFHLSAQAHLTGYYERFGFAGSGAVYLEDGIPHVAMDRPAACPGPR